MFPPVHTKLNKLEAFRNWKLNEIYVNYCGLYFSTPAPGYFDDDDILDFMVHWNVGVWPWYSSSNVRIFVDIESYL